MSHNYLNFFVRTLSLINMWPQNRGSINQIKHYYVAGIIFLTSVPVTADLVAQVYEDDFSISSINENFIALSALLGVTYLSFCFINRGTNIVNLIENIAIFEIYSPRSLMISIDESIKFKTKLFIIYGIIGNIGYSLLPILDYNTCQKNKPSHMIRFGIPCGLVARFLLPFRFDYSPLREIVLIYESGICILATIIFMVVSMLICGVLIHITEQLKYLKKFILELNNADDGILENKMKICVKHHDAIIEFATRADFCFNQMMLLHITWTGFVISVLGFEITATSNYVEGIRFVLHLFGWLTILFLVCFYGQKLMDQSLAVSDAIYRFHWYTKNINIQKYTILILVRSQRPLTLKACGLKVMSLATFLAVMYSAYSYFTLLLKFN